MFHMKHFSVFGNLLFHVKHFFEYCFLNAYLVHRDVYSTCTQTFMKNQVPLKHTYLLFHNDFLH